MNRATKYVSIIVAIIVIIFVVLFVIAFSLTRPNKLKPFIAKQVYKATGRHLTFQGNFHWSLSPLGFKVKQVSLSNPEGFKNPELITVGNASLHVKFFPLLTGKIQATDLSLKNVTVHLEKNTRGKNNWTFQTVNTQTDYQSTSNEKNTTDQDTQQHKNWNISAPTVRLNNMDITYYDAQTKQHVAVRNINFSAEDLNLNHPFPIELSLAINNQQPEITGSANLTGKLSINPNTSQYALNDIHFASKINNGIINENVIDAQLLGNVHATDKNMNLDVQQLTLNDSHIKGHANINNFKRPHVDFSLQADKINLDDYLPVKNDSATEQNKTTNEIKEAMPKQNGLRVKKQSQQLDLSALRQFTLDGTVDIQTLKAAKATLTNVHTTASVRNGVLTLNPIKASLYQGTLQGKTTIDASQPTSKITAQGQLAKVEANGLLGDMYDIHHFSGVGALQFNINTRGNTHPQLLQNLNGDFSANINNAKLQGIDIAYYVHALDALIAKQSMPSQTGNNETKLGHITAKGQIQQGVAKTHQLTLISPIMHADGQLQASLPKQYLSGKLNITPTKGSMQHAKALSVTLPVVVKGPFDDVDIQPQYQQALTDLAQEYVTHEAKKKVQEGINSQLKLLQQKLLGQ